MPAISKPVYITEVKELTVQDLERLRKDRATALPQKLRDSHHMVARLAAAGLTRKEIAERTGYNYNRVCVLLGSPAMEDLVARYREKIDERFIASVDSYMEVATHNMLAAERHIADRIDSLDEAGELLGIREALAISRDAADRFGYGKRQTNLNINADFATALEKAIKRSGKSSILEGSPVPTVTQRRVPPTLASPISHPSLSEEAPRRLLRRA